MLVKISDIKVKKRVRQELGDLEGLKNSLRMYGLLNPITLSSKYELIAGERRLEAAKAIGWESINAVVLGKDIDAIGKLEMELEENNQRKAFTEEELLEGYHRLEKLRNPGILMRIWAFICRVAKAVAKFFKSLFTAKKKKQALPPKNSGVKAAKVMAPQSAQSLQAPLSAQSPAASQTSQPSPDQQ
jgi:ParB family chromosome partitioning protein